ncbi:hypothetical protein HGR_16917 [Hylemonella gracilis ATCC 19624]|uniref:Uncharacterized protein n=1 Tax=Hylemonella gracilis ATCC 19624 TaxID=887062 RepID=F3KY37_9BURK|nr:hypothetical protein HGR_16917 [Hylemonella gracilis ATCC 19624]
MKLFGNGKEASKVAKLHKNINPQNSESNSPLKMGENSTGEFPRHFS